MNYDLISYSTHKYNFHELVSELFGNTQLRLLHTIQKQEYPELFKVSFDSISEFHQMFYNKYHKGWVEFEFLYFEFIKNVIAPFYDKSFLYQKFPTFRVHLLNQVSVGAFHTDADFGHPKFETNYIIPLTNSIETATIWVESLPGVKDYQPVSMIKGFCIKFNGNKLSHGNKVNETGLTRVSLDFRVITLADYNRNGSVGKSITQKTKFTEGAYYSKFYK